MQQPPLTIEQQRLLLRRREEGWKAANDDQAAAARARTEAEKWAIADELQRLSDGYRGRHSITPSDPYKHGLVVQQRWFARLSRRA
jgi:hypothetical protein